MPFAAGGAVDTSARLIAQRLSATIGTVIVDNRPGAGGAIAAKVVARAQPDGYTLFFGSSGTLAIGPQLNSEAGYDPVRSFGVLAPAGIPVHIIVKLNAAINEALRSPELGASFSNLMAQLMIGSPSDFGAFIAEQIAKWGTVIRTAGIKAE